MTALTKLETALGKHGEIHAAITRLQSADEQAESEYQKEFSTADPDDAKAVGKLTGMTIRRQIILAKIPGLQSQLDSAEVELEPAIREAASEAFGELGRIRESVKKRALSAIRSFCNGDQQAEDLVKTLPLVREISLASSQIDPGASLPLHIRGGFTVNNSKRRLEAAEASLAALAVECEVAA